MLHDLIDILSVVTDIKINNIYYKKINIIRKRYNIWKAYIDDTQLNIPIYLFHSSGRAAVNYKYYDELFKLYQCQSNSSF